LITEVDTPEGVGRCRCMCVFDFEMTLKNVPAGDVKIALERHVTDQGSGPAPVLSQTIDTSAGSGSIVVDTSEAMFCEEKTDPNVGQLTHRSKSSDCGGFNAKSDTTDYCSAERLHWQYHNGTLTLDNKRVLLNCCGERTSSASFDAQTLVVAQLDQPGDAGRCRCKCVFDLQLAVSGGALPRGGVLPIKLTRTVSDAGSATTSVVLESTIDLDQQSGTIVINNDDAVPWCQ
jgi:hypothetical protein